MKKRQILILTLLALFFVACSDDGIDKNSSVFDNSLNKTQNEFDRWLDRNYLKPYNIKVIYNYVDIQSNYSYTLIPADFEKSKALTYLAKYLWIEPYEEHINAEFFRSYAPRVLHFVGNPGWKSNNTVTKGEAEGGLRISFFDVNSLDPTNPSSYMGYVKTMHHEYAHIFQQMKVTDPAFDQITPGAYVSDNWSDLKTIDAWRIGFISPYAASGAGEDFVEIFCRYVVNTPEYWEYMLKEAAIDSNGKPADGAKFIQQKFEIVFNYYKDSWGIDINELRSIVNRRMRELKFIDLNALYNS